MDSGLGISISKSISSEKTIRKVKVKRKLLKIELKREQEMDYMLETEGDIKNYLRNPCYPNFQLKIANGKPAAYNLIGPPSLFSSKAREQLISRTLVKKVSNGSNRSYARQSMLINKIDHHARFSEAMQRIYAARDRAQKEEREINKQFNELELDSEHKSSKSLNPKLRSSSDLSKAKRSQNLLSDNSRLGEFGKKKTKREETSSMVDYGNHMLWYMLLRESNESEHLESYMPIGNGVNGLFTKIKKPVQPSGFTSQPSAINTTCTGSKCS